MRTIARRQIGAVIWLAGVCLTSPTGGAAEPRLLLTEGWLIQSSSQVREDGDVVSTEEFTPDRWYPTLVPATVLNVLTKRGVYPDLRIGLNSFRIADASDEFNRQHDLAQFSHLPDKRNPWKEPYWYRTEFTLPETAKGKRVWLNLSGVNYRADVWLNGAQIADSRQVLGSFSRYRFDVTDQVRIGRRNCLAIKVHAVDHPAVPDTQLDVLGRDRNYRKEIMKDVTLVMSIGYDCMPTVPDRQTGLWQSVSLELTGPVDIRNPFVATRLPLPQTNPARLTVSAELVNASATRQSGVLKGRIEETGGEFEAEVELAPGETRQVAFLPEEHAALVVERPHLWWPRNYGSQPLYHLRLRFDCGTQASDEEPVTFGIRQIGKELHKLDGSHGLRVLVNGQRIFCRGGYIQPEILFDWDERRMEAEIRYLTEANLNLVYFEDIPNPPDEFLDLCDRYGLMFGDCFYGCYWMTPGSGYPTDLDLLARGTADIVKRYRNHPSLVLYMAMNEGDTRQDVYEMWRKTILELDGTRIHIPSGSFPDYREDVPAWIRQDMPVGMNDWVRGKSYGWQDPAQYFRWVRDERGWMFQMECGSASLPPVDSLRRFIPDLWEAQPGPHFPLTRTWAHHGANHYFKPYDAALRRLHGEPTSVEDYCMKGHLVTADQHRAMFEAVNHRMWDITSGLTQWKSNACWPSVQWQLYDWFLKPMVSYYYVKKACEPLHVQLCPLDGTVAVINQHLEPQSDLEVRARVYDFSAKLRWEKTAKTSLMANSYKNVLTVPSVADLTPVYFVKLELKQAAGELVSDNFYWLPLEPHDFTPLAGLPPVRLVASHEVADEGPERAVRVRVTNPTDRLAFFTHLALTKGAYGEEILPVFWDDNYFSLLPGESKVVRARLAVGDIDPAAIALEVGGWNVESRFECTRLLPSKTRVKRDEQFAVTAVVSNTFIDGSQIGLDVDGRRVANRLMWARAGTGTTRRVTFPLKLSSPGTHEVSVGTERVSVVVE